MLEHLGVLRSSIDMIFLPKIGGSINKKYKFTWFFWVRFENGREVLKT